MRWNEHRQISAIACKLISGNLAIADGGQLTMQVPYWRAMLRCRMLEVDNADQRARLQRGREIIQRKA